MRISVRIPIGLHDAIKEEGRTVSDVVREALEDYLKSKRKCESAFDAFNRLALIGCVKRAPRDLSTNKRYFRGFGK